MNTRFTQESASNCSGSLFDIGGGIGGKEDQLHFFEKGLGGRSAPFHLSEMILDPPRYENLTRRHAFQHAQNEYFLPAYRIAS